MTIDNYQPCPCGSGKKIKFCKCVDQPQEYEKLVKLIQGDQALAAMDRINQLLAKTPSAAWLLAMKADVALRLNEVETFKETVGRFYKLKPDNPLALIMRSLVSFSEGEPVADGVRLLLEGLAESRESVHEISLDSLQVLCVRLRQSPAATLRHFWLELIEQLTNREITSERIDSGLLDDSVLTKAQLVIDSNLNGKPWAERAQEVQSLAVGFRYGQAETKLRSILRDYPDQVWPLQKLLELQMVLLDQDGATATARKLSNIRELDELNRDYFAALALELEPNKVSLAPQMLSRYVELESDAAAREAMGKIEGAWLVPNEASRQMAEGYALSVQDEVPAHDVYIIYQTHTLSDGTECEFNVGSVAIFGRQTDKPTRALIDIIPSRQSEALFQKLIEMLAPKAELTDPSAPRSTHYLELITRPAQRKGDNQESPLSRSQYREIVITNLLSLPLPALDNLTLVEAAEQEPKRAMVRAFLTHLESCQNVNLPQGTIPAIYGQLNLAWPETDLMKLESAPASSLLSLLRCDLSKVTEEQLVKLFITYIRLRLGRALSEAAREVLAREKTPALNAVRLPALQTASRDAEDYLELLNFLSEIEELQVAQKQPVGETVIQRFEVLNQIGRIDEARTYMQQAVSKYRNDPILISFIQRLNQQLQRQRGGMDEGAMLQRMSSRRTEADAEPQSSLVLPGQAAETEPGKSKLWLPGS